MSLTRCLKCGRRLTDPESVRRGIGPECKYRSQSTFTSEEVNRWHDKLKTWAALPAPRRCIRFHYTPHADAATVSVRAANPFVDLFLYEVAPVGDERRFVAVVFCGARRHQGRTARAAWPEILEAVQTYQTLIDSVGPTAIYLAEGYCAGDLFRYKSGQFDPWELSALAAWLERHRIGPAMHM